MPPPRRWRYLELQCARSDRTRRRRPRRAACPDGGSGSADTGVSQSERPRARGFSYRSAPAVSSIRQCPSGWLPSKRSPSSFSSIGRSANAFAGGTGMSGSEMHRRARPLRRLLIAVANRRLPVPLWNSTWPRTTATEESHRLNASQAIGAPPPQFPCRGIVVGEQQIERHVSLPASFRRAAPGSQPSRTTR